MCERVRAVDANWRQLRIPYFDERSCEGEDRLLLFIAFLLPGSNRGKCLWDKKGKLLYKYSEKIKSEDSALTESAQRSIIIIYYYIIIIHNE